MPQSRAGRFFAVCLVVARLFIVSIFVTQINASMTINAINENVQDLNDLDGNRVGTIVGSTSSDFLNGRAIGHFGYDDTAQLFRAFEAESLDAIVFDAPILAY